jgi:acetyl esterase/lipase
MAVVAAALSAAPGPARAEDAHPVIRLWTGKAPGEAPTSEPEKSGAQVTNVVDPTLTFYAAPKDHNTGAVVIIAPGGAYRFLSWDLEGTEVARKFNESGVNAFILKYRVPLGPNDPGARLPLMDGQRSISLVRNRASEWGIDPHKIGFLGFSAGGNLGAKVSNQFDHRAYDAADAVDQVSCRPDFAVLIYAGMPLDPSQPSKLPVGMAPSSQTPPTFLAVAADDNGCRPCTVQYFLAANAAGVKSELHVYTSGGHGFGLRPRVGATATWPDRCVEWMRGIGILPGAAAR